MNKTFFYQVAAAVIAGLAVNYITTKKTEAK